MDLGRKSIVEWAESAPDGGTDFTPAQEKYHVEAPIGSGGMGEVLLVTDQDLRRQVAMKLIRKDAAIGQDQRLHFIAEAQATSQLEHPGIPPVHDIGLTAEGRLYFTMKLVQGRTLREVLHDLLLKRREVHREYTQHKLISILERVCEPLHFSHEKGVVHRDLKPENIMLGDYGEVHVMDWGLARIDQQSSEYSEIGAVETARKDAGLDTQYGVVKGTLPYMSPEQLRGEEIDRRTDLYAVGCLLYEILTLQMAFDPEDGELVAKKQSGEVPDVRTRNPRRPVPEPLAAICQKALATDPADRYETAEDLAEDLRRWLDGRAERERRHQEAERLATDGRQASQRYLSLRGEIAAAEAEAAAEARNHESWQPVSEKRPLIEARERAEQLKVDLALAFAEAHKLLDGALLQEPDNKSAKAELVGVWTDRLQDAERRRDKADTAYAKVMIERYADAPLAEEGRLILKSDPPAEVFLSRFEEQDGVRTPVDEQSLGTTPLGPVTLPSGSYLCLLKAEGCRDTRYPVLIERDQTWTGEVKLKTEDEIGEGFVHVPAGPFVYGEGDNATTKTLPDFAIAGCPVTFHEYLEFLATLDDEEAEQRKPQTPGDGPYVERDEQGRWHVLPILVEGPAREWCFEQYGEGFELRLPVIGIDYDDAEAYCKWKSSTTGREHRLPTEEEREKAARGVDGRRFAWGDLEDASLGKCRGSRKALAQPEPVGALPTAASVYGMKDASGGVWDWTSSWEDERGSARVLRGGSWNNLPIILRCANRHSHLPRERDTIVGVRCARGF
ncbi:MAG: SUMF1/EgtB/PvdO family nonheme iron enzyme [Planctomycetota bacterium]|nr:SUMF1/EgtB/PvdO family nonheme iron enzyme [Planctomycetota bacterium]